MFSRTRVSERTKSRSTMKMILRSNERRLLASSFLLSSVVNTSRRERYVDIFLARLNELNVFGMYSHDACFVANFCTLPYTNLHVYIIYIMTTTGPLPIVEASGRPCFGPTGSQGDPNRGWFVLTHRQDQGAQRGKSGSRRTRTNGRDGYVAPHYLGAGGFRLVARVRWYQGGFG